MFAQADFPKRSDPDVMLYSGGFFGSSDKSTMAQVRNSSVEELRDQRFHFEDKRLDEMLFRYRARNFPETLSEEEVLLWQEFCYQRITDPEMEASITLEAYLERIHELMEDESLADDKRKILESLLEYSDMLLA